MGLCCRRIQGSPSSAALANARTYLCEKLADHWQKTHFKKVAAAVCTLNRIAAAQSICIAHTWHMQPVLSWSIVYFIGVASICKCRWAWHTLMASCCMHEAP